MSVSSSSSSPSSSVPHKPWETARHETQAVRSSVSFKTPTPTNTQTSSTTSTTAAPALRTPNRTEEERSYVQSTTFAPTTSAAQTTSVIQAVASSVSSSSPSPSALYPYPVPVSPVASLIPVSLNSHLSTFGRAAQLFQMNVDSTYLSFSSLLRLIDSYSMLKSEMVSIGQTFTAMNIFALIAKRLWRLGQWIRFIGRQQEREMQQAWEQALHSNEAAVKAQSSSLSQSDIAGFFSGWTWNLFYLAVLWNISRWTIKKIQQRNKQHQLQHTRTSIETPSTQERTAIRGDQHQPLAQSQPLQHQQQQQVESVQPSVSSFVSAPVSLSAAPGLGMGFPLLPSFSPYSSYPNVLTPPQPYYQQTAFSPYSLGY